MAGTIWVAPHPSLRAQNRVALYETHPDHPDGEVAIDGADAGPHEVAETPSVLDALSSPGPGLSPRLVRVDTPRRAPAPVAPPSPPASQQAGQPVITDAQRGALEAAGFDTTEKIRAATDEQLLAVEGIGPATVTRLREATKE